MQWPLKGRAVAPAEVPFYNLQYLHACPPPSDPTMIWGSDVDTTGLDEYIRDRNRTATVLVSPAHVLLQAAGRALAAHPQLNRRVVGRRLYDYRQVNVLTSLYVRRRGEVVLVSLSNVDTISLERIAKRLWDVSCETQQGKAAVQRDKQRLRKLPDFALQWLIRSYLWLDQRFRLPVITRIDRYRSAPVLVNYLAFRGAPPMRSYKPARYPSGSWMLNVTMGPSEPRPVVHEGQIVIRPMAPLYVRSDHRVVDGYQLGGFMATLRSLLSDPSQMERTSDKEGRKDDSLSASIPNAA